MPAPNVEVVMLRLHKRGPPLVASDEAQAYRDLVVSGFTAWRPTIGAALARSFGARAAPRLLHAAALDPALRPAQVPFEAWLRLYAAFARLPDALHGRMGGAEARLRRQQSHLRKEHRPRAPRDALGSARQGLAAGPRVTASTCVRFPWHPVGVTDPKAVVRRGYDLHRPRAIADDGCGSGRARAAPTTPRWMSSGPRIRAPGFRSRPPRSHRRAGDPSASRPY